MNHQRKITFSILLFFLASFAFSSKLVKLGQVVNPNSIKVDKDRIYITAKTSVYIYSLKDFRLIKKFGQAGQGPREFQLYMDTLKRGEKISLTPTGNQVIVGSLKKVSFFSREGEYLKEMSLADSMLFSAAPVEENFIGVEMKREGFTNWYYAFNLYDSKGKKIKELCKHKKNIHTGQLDSSGLGYVFKDRITKGPEYAAGSGRIFISGAKGFTIDIYDKNGSHVDTIKLGYEKQKLDSQEKQKVIEAYKTNPRNWNRQKKVIKAPDYYPEFRTLQVADGKLYVETYKKQGKKTEFYIFDVNGKFLKKGFFHINYMNYIEAYPYALQDGIVYQLVENEAEEIWELHIFPLEAGIKAAPMAAPTKSPAKKKRLIATAPQKKAASPDKPQTLSPQQLLNNLKNKKYTGKPFEQLSFGGAPLPLIIRLIKEQSGLNFVIEPGVTGKVNCNIKNVPWDQFLASILEKNGLKLVLEQGALKIRKK